MRKYIQIISRIVLVIAFIDLAAFSVAQVTRESVQLGVLTSSFKTFSGFPLVCVRTIKELFCHESFKDVAADFEEIRDLDYDVFAVSSRYDNYQWIINLTNLKNDSLIHSWHVTKEDYCETGVRVFSHARFFMPTLLKDKSLVVTVNSTNNLFRLDSCSNIIWHNTEHYFHHSINLDKDGNIWACTMNKINFDDFKDCYGKHFRDDCITKIDMNTGRVLFNKSIREIFIKNNLGCYVYGCIKSNDIFHLNDIQPILKNGPYWKEGDLLISLRNKSMIFLYRPSTNKIIRTIRGPFCFQHDVDIHSDSTITLFNNNKTGIKLDNYAFPNTENEFEKDKKTTMPMLNKISQVVMYNLKDSTFSYVDLNQFVANKIFSASEGLHHILSNGDMFVESQNQGTVYIFNKNKVLLKKYFNPIVDGKSEQTNWIKIYENIDF